MARNIVRSMNEAARNWLLAEGERKKRFYDNPLECVEGEMAAKFLMRPDAKVHMVVRKGDFEQMEREFERSKRDSSSRRKRGRRDLSEVERYTCGEEGHYSYECPKRKKNRKMKGNVYAVDRGGRSLVFEVTAGGAKVRCLSDTGANVSLIREEALQNVEVRGRKRSQVRITSASDHTLKAEEQARVRLEFERNRWWSWLFVVSNLSKIMEGQGMTISFAPSRKIVIGAVMTDQLRLRLESLATRYQDVFVKSLGRDVGRTNVEEVELMVDPSSKPAYSRNYRMSLEIQEVIGKEVEQMLENGVIEETDRSALDSQRLEQSYSVSKEEGWRIPILRRFQEAERSYVGNEWSITKNSRVTGRSSGSQDLF